MPSPEAISEVLKEDETRKSEIESTELSKLNLKTQVDPLDYFVKSEQGILISQSIDYKGKSRKEQQERFALLYVWAYNEILVKAMCTVEVNHDAFPRRSHRPRT
ncbi:MAG: hypothetical protein L6R45_15240 [Anaerolineae bacterium]|nr:hypothetical protein [Anaerolineae bacterium]